MRQCLLLLILIFPHLSGAGDQVPATPLASAAGEDREIAQKRRVLTIEELKKFFAVEKDRITTDWIDQYARMRIHATFKSAGYLTVMCEGRSEDGRMLFRESFKHLRDVFSDAEEVRSVSSVGLSVEDFDSKNADLQKSSYTLMQVQTYEDVDGATRYCAVWVNPHEQTVFRD